MSQLATEAQSTSTPQEPDTARHGAPPPLVFAAPLLAGLLLNRSLPLRLTPNRSVRVAGIVLAVTGFALGGAAVREMRHAGNSPNPMVPVRAVVAGGPFRYTRNPMYLGMSLIYVGLSLIARAAWPLFLLPATLARIIEAAIRPEERYLERKFADSYRRYKEQVRRWI